MKAQGRTWSWWRRAAGPEMEEKLFEEMSRSVWRVTTAPAGGRCRSSVARGSDTLV